MDTKKIKVGYERPSVEILSFCHGQILMASNSCISTNSNEAFGDNGTLTEFEW